MPWMTRVETEPHSYKREREPGRKRAQQREEWEPGSGGANPGRTALI